MVLSARHAPGARARLAVAAAALGAVAIVAGRAAADVAPTAAMSSNWAGYVAAATALASGPTAPPATQLAFTDVTGTWVEPRAVCGPGEAASSAFWVGLGGAAGTTAVAAAGLEQIGSETDCSPDGSARHGLWYELLPAPPVPIRLKVAPGDTLTAAVLVRGTTVTLQITNRTRHTRFTKNVTLAAPDLSSAEWIAEAPSLCRSADRCRPVPLADFGTTVFTHAAATANGHSGVISDPAWTATPVELVPDRARRGFPGSGDPYAGTAAGAALPGPLGPDGRTFAVHWQSGADG